MPRLLARQNPPARPSRDVRRLPVCGTCGHRASFYVAPALDAPIAVDEFTPSTRPVACGRCRSRTLFADRDSGD